MDYAAACYDALCSASAVVKMFDNGFMFFASRSCFKHFYRLSKLLITGPRSFNCFTKFQLILQANNQGKIILVVILAGMVSPTPAPHKPLLRHPLCRVRCLVQQGHFSLGCACEFRKTCTMTGYLVLVGVRGFHARE